MFFPPLGLVVPFLKVKRYRNYSYFTHLMINFIAILIVGSFDYTFGLVYLAYLSIEVIYYLSKKYTKLEVLDKINISSLVGGLLIFIATSLIMKSGVVNVESIKEIYVARAGMNALDVDEAFKYIGSNKYFLIFIFTYLQSFILYAGLKEEKLNEWKISYLWVILYIVPFIFKYISKNNSDEITNILKIVPIMFYVFGIKEFLKEAEKRIKSNFFAKFLTVFFFSVMPLSMFIYGGMMSFKDEDGNVF